MIKSFWKGRILLTKSRLITGCVLAIVSLVSCIWIAESLKAGIFFAAAFLLITPFTFRMEFSPRLTALLYGGLAVCFAAATLFMSQLAVDQLVTHLPVWRMLLGILLCLIPILLIYAISLNYRLSVLISSLALLLLTSINTYVYLFRGNELTLSDFLSVGTAVNVVTAYSVVVPKNLLFAWLFFVLTMLFLYGIPQLKTPRHRLYTRLAGAGSTLLCIVLLWAASGTVPVYNWQNGGSVNNGFLLNFVLQLRTAFVREPAGYDPSKLDELAQEYESKEIPDAYPDVIVIMNETFADLSVLGSEPSTNTELLPYFRSLQENTVRGYALSSVLGGRTPNSEYEFLTGNTTAFLPTGAIPFQQYIDSKHHSVASVLAGMGYATLATHPNEGNNWMRNGVWELLGFDRYTFIEDYPQKDMPRGYVSDAEMYDRLIEYYEQYTKNGNLFLYGVTMQNHGPYDFEDYPSAVKLEGYKGDYPEAEQYLTTLNASDAALERLITYFEQSERPVVLLMFGDHLPNLPKEFYEELHGGPFDTPEEQMLQYTVPFMIWANYDIEEGFVECTSLNYLSNYLYEAAGIPLPAYNRFLAELEREIPRLNAYYYYSAKEQAYLPYERRTGKIKELLSTYEHLQYNSLFDPKHRNEIFFPVH